MFNIIKRKKAGGDVIGGYSHLVPSGHLPRFSFSWFCVPVYNVVFMARAASPRRSSRDRLLNCTAGLPVVSWCDPETSRDHLLITCSTGQLKSRQYSARAVVFCTSYFLRASVVVENRALANCVVRQLSSNRTVDFSVTKSKRSELEGTSDRASSRLLCIRCSVVDVKGRDDVASDPNNRSSTSPRASRVSVAENQDACRLCRTSSSSEASRRARTGRLLPYHDDAFRRAAVRVAADAPVAEAAADARAAECMLWLYVVCFVSLCVFQF